MPTVADLVASKKSSTPCKSSPTIDFYRNAWAKEPTATTTLADLIDAIRSDEYAAPVAKVRAALAADDLKAAEVAKKNLPAVSLSGVVDGQRMKAASEGRFTHSGLLQIDLDKKDNPKWSVDDMRDVLIGDAHMVAVFVTPSGKGVKGIARIQANADTHLGSFLAAEAYFAEIGLKVDPSCKDPVRLCFVSHDPDAWIRATEEAEVFEPMPEADDDDDFMPYDEMIDTPNAVKHSESGGIIIRGTRPATTAETVRDMLNHIPPRPEYGEWLKIASAVWDALGEAAGTAALVAWSPEEREGEYAKKFSQRLKDVTAGTLFHRAQAHGWAPPQPQPVKIAPAAASAPGAVVKDIAASKDPNAIPAHIFPVPNGEIRNELAARHIFSLIAPTHRLFSRAATVHEVVVEQDEPRLEPVKAARLTSLIEEFGPRVMAREKREDGSMRWRSKLMASNHCEMLLNSTAAREQLPRIQQITGSPVLAWTNEGPQLLAYGWHPHAGGTFVTGRQRIPTVSLDEALAILFGEVLVDIDFAGPGEASRAAASFISPALKIGRWIDDDFPIDVAEADQSQAGKSYRHKLIAAVYGEIPYTITNATGGVGSFDERIGGALIAGRPLITLENIRGRIDSQTLESAIRGQARVTARSFRACVEVETAPFLWQLSTNGAELTRDLANRAVITRIRKQAPGYQYRTWPEGEILHHIKAHQPRYLAAVHAVLNAWAEAGRPRTNETRHDFRGWVRALDWIVQNIMGLAPLMEDHQEQQLRTANPKLQWLRDVVRAMLNDGHDPMTAVTASDFAEASEENDLAIPGRRATSQEAAEVSVGRILGRIFKDAATDIVTVDGISITRQISFEHDAMSRERERKTYVIQPKQP